jgi:hypothetical protein
MELGKRMTRSEVVELPIRPQRARAVNEVTLFPRRQRNITFAFSDSQQSRQACGRGFAHEMTSAFGRSSFNGKPKATVSAHKPWVTPTPQLQRHTVAFGLPLNEDVIS